MPHPDRMWIEDLAIRGIVVDNERRHARQIRVRGPSRRVPLSRSERKAHGEPERGPLTGLALEADPAPHHLDEAGRDGQPKARPTESPRGRGVDLHIRPEQGGLTVERDTQARVADGDPDHDLLGVTHGGICGHGHDDLAPLRELHGVVDEVHEDLSKAARVSDERIRHVGIDVQRELEALLGGPLREELDRLWSA